MPVTTAALPVADITSLGPIIPSVFGRRRRKVLIIINGKGGVGKSSLAAALAVSLTRINMRVLLVEMDPQGNNGEDLGFISSPLYDNGAGQAQAILEGTGLKPTGEARPGLWVVPGGPELEEIQEELYVQRRLARQTGDSSWVYMYAAAIAQVEDDYDMIILDVAPGSLVLQMQAMVAGHMVMVPSRSDESSRKGLRTVVRRYLDALPFNPSLVITGIVLFGVTSGAARVTAEIRELLENDVRGAAPVYETVIRYVEKAAVECRRNGKVPDELAREEWLGAPSQASLLKSVKGLAADYRGLMTEYLTEVARIKQADENEAAS